MESFRQNNFTAEIASQFLAPSGSSSSGDGSKKAGYWLGLKAHNQLQTNTLAADAGHQVRERLGERERGERREREKEREIGPIPR